MLIRDFEEGEEAALHDVFFSAVRQVAIRDYTPEQIVAWAPSEYDKNHWIERIRNLQPFVAEIDGCVVGYADLQPSGYIDHFFVSSTHGRRGVGTALMEHIHRAAHQRQIAELWADVSLTAEPFFGKWGFVVELRKAVTLRDVELFNARMRKRLAVGKMVPAK
jgi:putative acetyltransferase